MAVTTTAAQDEFDALLARNDAASRPSARHRFDSDSSAASSSSPRVAARARPKGDSSDEDDDDDDGGTRARLRTAAAPTRRLPPPRGANTGPKGVIADAAAFDSARRERERRLRHGRLAPPSDEGPSGADREAGGHWDEKDCASDAGLDGSDADAGAGAGAAAGAGAVADGDADAAFLGAWRRRRIEQLAARSSTGAGTGAGASSPLRHVGGAGFLRALESARRGQSVIVYIGDPSPPPPSSSSSSTTGLSDAYATHLGTLAGKHTGSVWVHLDAETAEVDEAGLPALLAYRDGEQVLRWVPLRDEVAVTCNVVTNLEEALRAEGVL